MKKHYFFENENVYTIGLDAHKTGHLPYPAGIFLCRKNLQQHVEVPVDYIYGHSDDTLIGSRNGVFALLGKWFINNIGENGQRDFVNYCLKGRDELVNEIKTKLSHCIELYHYQKYMNYISFSFKNITDKQIENCENILMLRYYLVDGKKIYKIPIMPNEKLITLAKAMGKEAQIKKSYKVALFVYKIAYELTYECLKKLLDA